MRRILITFLCVMTLAMVGQRAWGFALLGPFAGPDATWQTITLGYDMAYENYTLPGSPNWLGDIGGPKNIGEGYRRNEKIIYYAYDSTFGGDSSGYFGLIGETNADLAFAMMNSVFTNNSRGVDGYSANLTEFPFNSQSVNYTAKALYLTDLKSVILHLLVEQMGLAEPERYTWTLHDRVVVSPPGCPRGVSYLVVQRNYGSVDQPLTTPETGTLYSPYVNNIYYTYGIADDCGVHPPAWTAITVPESTDTTKPEYTAVAANNFEGGAEAGLGGLDIGGYYTGLTEDDVAGLRYLMTSNNVVFESPSAGSQLEATNFSTLQLLQTSSLYQLYQFAQTNPPSALLTQFPNLEIDSVSNYFTLVTNFSVFSYFTNLPGSANGTPPTFVIGTNGFTLSVQTNYVYTFGNVVYVEYHTNTPAKLETLSLSIKPGSPFDAPIIQTNVTIKNIVLTNVISGDYYTLPTNSCGIDIIKTLVSNYFAGSFTNIITESTNTVSTVAPGFIGSQSIVVNFTNNWFEYYSCNLETSGPAEYQGTEGVKFVRVSDSNVDPLTDVFYQPITTNYTMIMVTTTNGQLVPQTFQRVVTQPDILLNTFDDAQANTFNGTVTRNINFEEGEMLPGLSGPGVIDGQSVFSFNRVGTTWWNGPFSNTNSFILGPDSEVNQTTGVPSLLWASFDGTTNPPIVYPNYLSIQDLESSMIITISPTSLPSGTNGVPYPQTTFSATGGTPGYTWSVAPGSSLPTGLFINNGTLQGIPNGNTNGVYDFNIQLTDSSFPAKVVSTPYTITINSQQ